VEQNIKGAGGGDLTATEWLSLNDQNRAIALDYALKPRTREIYGTSGGKVLLRYFRKHHDKYHELVSRLPELQTFFSEIPADADPSLLVPFWNNGWFPPLDAISLCALLYIHRPKRYVEVGSGNSTKFARAIIDRFELPTQVISIDPYPRADIDQLCDRVYRYPLEDAPRDIFDDLTEKDIFFIDSSHRSFQNSDVTVFFLEVLPSFAPSMIYGIHDIFLPFDYPESFVPRFYNEQFLLATYLLGGTSDEAVFPCSYVAAHAGEFDPLLKFGEQIGIGDTVLGGGAFWARKGVSPYEAEQRSRQERSSADKNDRAG
jgi:hypothetical protein